MAYRLEVGFLKMAQSVRYVEAWQVHAPYPKKQPQGFSWALFFLCALKNTKTKMSGTWQITGNLKPKKN